MKSLFLVVVLLVLSHNLYSQCDHFISETGKIETKHRTNQIDIIGLVDGVGSSEKEYYYSDYEAPILDIGYTKSLWVVGVSPIGNIKMSANHYPSQGEKHFIPGPFKRDLTEQEIVCDFFNRVWHVSRLDVLATKNLFESGTITTEQIPIDILEWPANGNPFIGDFAPDYDMAPFHDNNLDGIYNPMDGDYPVADASNLNLQPHQFNFSVYNDNSSLRNTFSEPVELEFHQMKYAFDCGTELSKSIFTKIKYLYRGNIDLFDVRIGLFEDNDLGCPTNIELGTDTSLNVTFSYKLNESDILCSGTTDFQADYTTIRTTLYNQKMKGAMYMRNINDGSFSQSEPANELEYYDVLGSKWRDGTPLTIGGDGYLDGTEETRFAFNGLPHLIDSWSSISLDLVDPRRITTIIEEDLNPGITGVIEFVDHIQVHDPSVGLTAFEDYEQTINNLKSEIDNMESGFDCAPVTYCQADCIWPGDANNDGIVSIEDIVFTGVGIVKNDAFGVERNIVSSSWFPFGSVEWSTQIDGNSTSFADANGNGVVNANDIDYLLENLYLQNANYIKQDPLITDYTDKGLSMELPISEYDAEDFPVSLFERFVEPIVRLGDPGEPLNEPLHGLSFKMRFDTMFVENIAVSSGIASSSKFEFEYSDYIAGTNGFLSSTNERGIVQYSFSNLGEDDIDEGFGLLRPTFIMKEFPETGNIDGRDTFTIDIVDIYALNSDGVRVDLGAESVDVILSNLTYNPDIVSAKEVLVKQNRNWLAYPNPASDVLNISFENNVSGQFEILGFDGTRIKSLPLRNQTELQLNLQGLNGMFLLTFTDDSGYKSIQRIHIFSE